jgi:hypothetical protein
MVNKVKTNKVMTNKANSKNVKTNTKKSNKNNNTVSKRKISKSNKTKKVIKTQVNTYIKRKKNYKKNKKNTKNKTKKGGNPVKIMYKRYLKIDTDDPTMNKNQPDRCKCVDYKSKGANMPNSELEITRCTRKVVKGSQFCSKHKNCGGYLRKFTSGFEPDYNPKGWSNPAIEGSHNCYAYFLDEQKEVIKQKCEEACHKLNKKGCPKKISECQNMIPQPGDYALLNKYGNLKKKDRDYTCPNMHNKIMADNPHIKPVGLLDKCPINHYKGAMTVDYKNTFHFYRQNPDGTWSHKPGILPVTDVDASGKKIYIPHFADRDYSKVPRQNPIKYTDFCGYYCLPTNEYYTTNMA